MERWAMALYDEFPNLIAFSLSWFWPLTRAFDNVFRFFNFQNQHVLTVALGGVFDQKGLSGHEMIK